MPTPLEQLAGLLGPTGTALAVAAIPVIATISAYVTRMGSQSKIDRLEGELKSLGDSKSDALVKAEQKYAELDERYQAIQRRGALIQSQLEVLTAEIDEIANQLDASDYSVLVPAPTSIPGDTPTDLVFLCASGPQAAKLQWVRVPIVRSLSGQVFLSGKSTIASPPASGQAFATRTDKVTNFQTNETLSVCLRHRGQRIGVAQFLNKRHGRFDANDADRSVGLCATLSIRVSDFTADPRRLVEMGHAPKSRNLDVTILFVDLSNYSGLFSNLDSSIITDLLNQYFQDLCAIAFRYGATADQFMGDGMLLVFNSEQSQSNHQRIALTAAAEMRAAFQSLRQRWTTLGYSGTDTIFVRLGLASGPVTRAELGHTQSRRVTVIGPAVNAAAYACDAGPRDRDMICIDASVKNLLGEMPELKLTALSGATTPTIFEAILEPS